MVGNGERPRCSDLNDLSEVHHGNAARGSSLLGTQREQSAPLPAAEAPALTHFAPWALWFVPGTLETAQPVAVLNMGTQQEQVFVGKWTDVIGSRNCLTNRAVVHVSPCLTNSSDSLKPLETPLSNNGDSISIGSGTETLVSMKQKATVPSLLDHTGFGVTADEERDRQIQLREGWTYDNIYVPAAVLIMERIL